ncbi:MAG TPA: hypothetical protein VF518_15985 [Polyangia bacterium]
MSKRTWISLFAACAFCLTVAHARPALAAPTAPAAADATLARMIEAVKAESYDAFLVDADARLKQQLSRQQFEGMCGLYTKQLKKGYTLEYFGQLRQRGMAVYIWKIAVLGAQDEGLLKMVMKDGKVAAFAVN